MTDQSTTVTFAELGLREEIQRAIAEVGYVHPTPIQARAIPVVLEGRDIVGIAQTGTGKTAGFTLPMLHKLAAGRARARMPRSLILSPTRELASQIADSFETYGKHLNLTMALLIGGVGMGDQEKLLEKGVDVLIATPGRLLDWFDRGRILMTSVEMFVIDEADRMLDMGFIPDVERIFQLLLKRGQTLLFSATMPNEVRKLADKFLRDPVQIEVARPSTRAEKVVDVVVPISALERRVAVDRLIDIEQIPSAIIFCNRKRDVSMVNKFLQRQGRNAQDIHGDLDQSQRQATLDAFKAGKVDFLVATDVAARGLDIVDLPAVINLDVPYHPDDYVHRIGRTGRAGKEGRAYTMADSDDAKYLAAIEKLLGQKLTRQPIEGISGELIRPTPPSRRQPAEPEPAATTAVTPAPAKRRRRKSEAPEPAAAEQAAAPAERTPGRRVRRSRAEPVAAEHQTAEPVGAKPAAAPADVQPTPAAAGALEESRKMPHARAAERGRGGDRKGQRGRDDGEREPVVGLGDHVPAFLLRPVPVKVSA